MAMWRRFMHGLRVLFDRRTADQEIADEVDHYLGQATAAYVARGLSPDDARRAARLELGGATNVGEQIRRYGWENLVGAALAARNLKIAIRGFLRTPGFTLTALLTLAISLGANVTIFAVIDTVLLQPLPFPNADRLIAIYNTYPKAGVDRDGSSVANYYERRARIPALANVALYRFRTATVGESRHTERIEVAQVTPEFFATLGTGLARGRAFVDAEMNPGTNDVVVVSDAFWHERLVADSNVLGRTLRVDGALKTIIGILPPDFRFLSSKAAMFLPLASRPEQRLSADRHSGSNAEMIARLRPGASIAEVQAQIDAQNTVIERTDPEARMMADAGFRSVVLSLHGDHVASIRPTLLLLQAGVLLLVLAAVVNLANLLSIRAAGRTKELMIRASMGATRGQLITQVVVETLALALAGGLLGLAVGALGIRFVGVLGVNQLPLGSHIAFDGLTMTLTLAGALFLGGMIGLPIAVSNTRGDLVGALKATSRATTSTRAAARFRNAFIVAQVALAFVLLSASMLLGLSLRRAMDESPGFVPGHVLSAQISLSPKTYRSSSALAEVTDRLARVLAAQPGVQSAGVITNIPLSGNSIKSGVTARGYTPRPGESLHGHYTYGVSGDYFAALGIPVRDGRVIGSAPEDRNARICVVDEDFARRYWPGARAIGQQVFQAGDEGHDDRAFTVVGVVGAVKQTEVTETAKQGAVYFPFVWRADADAFIVTRTAQDVGAFGAPMARVVRGLDPDLALASVRTMDARIADSLVSRRSPVFLAVIFACVALLLAAIGTYGVLSYAVAQRHREIGVRLALGAPPGRIGAHFMSRGLRLLGVGLAIGLAGVWMVGRAMERVLFGVAAFDAPAIGAAIVVISLASVAAMAIPARRAARIDPMIVMTGD